MIYIPPLEEEVDSTVSAVEDGGVQNISRIKIYRTAIIQNRYYLSASQMLILNPSRYKREGTGNGYQFFIYE